MHNGFFRFRCCFISTKLKHWAICEDFEYCRRASHLARFISCSEYKVVKRNAFIVSSVRCSVYQKRLTYITNYVLTSRHECKFGVSALDLSRPRRLTNSKLYSRFCSKHLPKKTYFASKCCFVVNVLSIGYGNISANANYVSKPALPV